MPSANPSFFLLARPSPSPLHDSSPKPRAAPPPPPPLVAEVVGVCEPYEA